MLKNLTWLRSASHLTALLLVLLVGTAVSLTPTPHPNQLANGERPYPSASATASKRLFRASNLQLQAGVFF